MNSLRDKQNDKKHLWSFIFKRFELKIFSLHLSFNVHINSSDALASTSDRIFVCVTDPPDAHILQATRMGLINSNVSHPLRRRKFLNNYK